MLADFLGVVSHSVSPWEVLRVPIPGIETVQTEVSQLKRVDCVWMHPIVVHIINARC